MSSCYFHYHRWLRKVVVYRKHRLRLLLPEPRGRLSCNQQALTPAIPAGRGLSLHWQTYRSHFVSASNRHYCQNRWYRQRPICFPHCAEHAHPPSTPVYQGDRKLLFGNCCCFGWPAISRHTSYPLLPEPAACGACNLRTFNQYASPGCSSDVQNARGRDQAGIIQCSSESIDCLWTNFFFQNEPYNFSHFLFISRNYHLTPEEESSLANSASSQHSRAKSSKKSKTAPLCPSPEPPADGIYPFHLEDEEIRALALHSLDYKYTAAPKEPREKHGFGLDCRARMMMVPAENFELLVNKLQEIYTETWFKCFMLIKYAWVHSRERDIVPRLQLCMFYSRSHNITAFYRKPLHGTHDSIVSSFGLIVVVPQQRSGACAPRVLMLNSWTATQTAIINRYSQYLRHPS